MHNSAATSVRPTGRTLLRPLASPVLSSDGRALRAPYAATLHRANANVVDQELLGVPTSVLAFLRPEHADAQHPLHRIRRLVDSLDELTSTKKQTRSVVHSAT